MLNIMLFEVLLFYPVSVKSKTGFEIFHYGNQGVVAKIDNAWPNVIEYEENWIKSLVPSATRVHFVKSYSKPAECDKSIKIGVITSPGIAWNVYIDPDSSDSDIEMALRMLISLIRNNEQSKVIYNEGCRQ